MFEISKEARMIIASNLTVAATIREAATSMKSGPQPTDSKDIVTRMFADILANIEKLTSTTA